MKVWEWYFAIFISALLSILLLSAGCSLVESPRSDSVVYDGLESRTVRAAATLGATPTFLAATTSEGIRLNPTPTSPPIKVGDAKKEDIADVLLLHDPAEPSNFDTNFCRVATHYGLQCQRLALNSTELSDAVLRDSQGAYFKLIGISASSMRPALLDDVELAILRDVVANGDVSLFVSKLREQQGENIAAKLTHNAILGVEKPADSHRDWLVATTAPEITQEFTGQVISPTRTIPQDDFAIRIGDREQVTPFITSTDDNGATYPIFVRWQQGTGNVFVDAGMVDENINDKSLAELYFHQKAFTQIIPLMFAMRYTLGQEVWHNDHNYANLTIDDPPLNNELFHGKRNMKYHQLLAEMEKHDFHTTIAFVPKNWEASEPSVIRLFFENPDRFSIVQHGNNHDGFEFYKYTVTEADEWRARPLAEQERDIVEGLARMWMHTYQTAVSFDQIMIFPYGNSPAPTLKLLKERNYLAAIRWGSRPLDAPDPDSLDFLVLPANLEYESFPVAKRIWIQTYDPEADRYDPLISVYQLFLDRPALLYSHHSEMFGVGIDGFSPIADQINNLHGEVEWRNLGNIIRHLYLEKVNDDGSVDVSMFSNNHLIVTNETDLTRTYHLSKKETLNVSIASLTVNGHDFPYNVDDGYLRLEAILPAHETMELVIEYGE